MTGGQRKPSRRLPDLSSQERLTYIALLQGGSRANQAARGVGIFLQGVVLALALMALVVLGWVVDISINGG